MKSVTGFILGLIGSVGDIFLSILLFIGYLLVFFGKSALLENNISTKLVEFASVVTMWLLFLSIWFLLFGVLGVIFSGMMNKKAKAGKGGIGCIISGVLSINPFLVIGGVMGVVADRSYEDAIYEG